MDCAKAMSGVGPAAFLVPPPVLACSLDGFFTKSLENFRLIIECTLLILCSECKLYTDGLMKRARPALVGEGGFALVSDAF